MRERMLAGEPYIADDPELAEASLTARELMTTYNTTGSRQAPLRRQLLEQLRLTDHTYCSYLQNSRYPHESRPAGHNPDQLYPNRPLLDANPMRVEGGDSDPSVMLQTTQSRVYLAAGETATLSLRATDARGQALPLTVTRAVAQGMRYGGQRPAPRVTLDFADGGAGA